jgi:hypothetical protein
MDIVIPLSLSGKYSFGETVNITVSTQSNIVKYGFECGRKTRFTFDSVDGKA